MKNIVTKSVILLFCMILSVSAVMAKSNYTYTQGSQYNPQAQDFSDTTEKVLFIIDFSNSMNEPLTTRKSKLDIALDTMYSILPRLNPKTYVGLRVYGHNAGFTPFASCRSSQLVSPIAPNNTGNIAHQLGRISAVGWTPITYSLKQAINNDFAGFTGQNHIIVLSDGGEYCDESPCKYIVEVMKYRDDIKIDVIAFDISDMEANNQLKCVSLVTSGKFYNAQTASELIDSMEKSLNMQKNVSGQIIIKE